MSRSNVLENAAIPGGLFDYIERFYNSRRRHSTLGYLSFSRLVR
jgi:hypothetical protein